MIQPIKGSKLLELDENEQRQLRRIKAELADLLVDEIYISLLKKKMEYEDYAFGDHTPEGMKQQVELNQREIRRVHNKLSQYVDRAVNGGFENEYENDKFENEWDDFNDPSEFDEGFQPQ
jgi:hypothetical protein